MSLVTVLRRRYFNTWKMKTDPNIDKIRFHTQYNLLLKTSKTLKKTFKRYSSPGF